MSSVGSLERYRASLDARAREWTSQSDELLKRRVTRAAHERDAEELWRLTETYLYTYGTAGAAVSPNTIRAYRRGVLDLVEAWAGENLLRPSRDAGPGYARLLEERALKTASVRVRLAAARALFRALRWSGATTADPFTETRASSDITSASEKVKPYRSRELDQLLWAADTTDKLLILLGAFAGLRVSEIVTLRGSDVDLPGRRLTVRHGKGRRQRSVVISNSLARLLATCAPVDGYVLPYRTPSNAYRRLKRLCVSTKVPFRGVHALRHAAGTRLMIEHNGNLEPVARHLGHANLDTTRIYVEWDDRLLEETVGKW